MSFSGTFWPGAVPTYVRYKKGVYLGDGINKYKTLLLFFFVDIPLQPKSSTERWKTNKTCPAAAWYPIIESTE